MAGSWQTLFVDCSPLSPVVRCLLHPSTHLLCSFPSLGLFLPLCSIAKCWEEQEQPSAKACACNEAGPCISSLGSHPCRRWGGFYLPNMLHFSVSCRQSPVGTCLSCFELLYLEVLGCLLPIHNAEMILGKKLPFLYVIALAKMQKPSTSLSLRGGGTMRPWWLLSCYFTKYSLSKLFYA